MSVNVSNRQFWQGRLIEDVGRLPGRARASTPAASRVEITEGVIMHDVKQAPQHAGRVSASWASSCTSTTSAPATPRWRPCTTCPIDALKIDRSFVARLGTGPRSRELVRTIVIMGLNLGLQLVAEGIETGRAAGPRTRSSAARYGQGYLFSRPLPGAEVEAYLAGVPTG